MVPALELVLASTDPQLRCSCPARWKTGPLKGSCRSAWWRLPSQPTGAGQGRLTLAACSRAR